MAIDLYKNRCSVYEGEKPYIFVSYSHKDIEKVVDLIRKLSLLGFRVWYDSGIPAGAEWREVIAAHLKNSRCVLSLLTPNSVESKHFKREFNYADYLEKDILAVYLEECEPSPGLEMQVASQQCIKCEHCENDEDLLEEIARAQVLLPCLGEKLDAKPETVPDLTPKDKNKTPKTRIDQLREKANEGDMKAQFDLGWAFDQGNGVPKNHPEAAKWYKKAAEQGYDNAQFNLGVFYERGYGVTQSYDEASKWYRKAAEKGYRSAQYNLGVFYEEGYGVNKDTKEAARLYQLAANQGHTGAQNRLAVCYEYGTGVDKDINKALELYRKSAELGNAYAQYNLGRCYEYSTGVAQDWDEAARWYRKSADQSHASAQKKMAELYSKGLGVPIDEAEADRWQKLYDENPNK